MKTSAVFLGYLCGFLSAKIIPNLKNATRTAYFNQFTDVKRAKNVGKYLK